MKFIYDLPDSDAKIIRSICKKYQKVVPAWVTRIKFSFDENMATDTVAEVSVRPDYLNASIFIGPRWRDLKPWHQKEVIVHELCHLHTSPVWKVGHDLTAELKDPLKSFVITEMSVALEAATEHLCQTFLRIVE